MGLTYSPTVPREGLQVTNFDQRLHTVMIIWKCTDLFRMTFGLGGGLRGGGYVGGSSIRGIGHGRREIP